MRIRSGYSFKVAYGHLEDVAGRLKEIGWKYQPISDTNSTFAFNRWSKLVSNPIYGVELAVVSQRGETKPIIDWWTFFAIDSLQPLHDLIGEATAAPDKTPNLLYPMAMKAKGVIKIAGNRALLEHMSPKAINLYIGLSPSTPLGLYKEAKKKGYKFIAVSDNVYPRAEDQETYRVGLGFRAGTQTYPQHILTDDEWKEACWQFDKKDLTAALKQRDRLMKECSKAKLPTASLYKPKKEKTLLQMCIEGARAKGVNLKDEVYSSRLHRELDMIKQKNFEDYFYIIADIITWAKPRMIVGPARGSSCGSLVCYLLDITAIDPIPYNLIFERFIDINRADLPDIDIDFEDAKRDEVFRYVEEKYGREHVARLGTVGVFRPRSAMNQVGMALNIPLWKTDKVIDSLIVRSLGDSRAMNCFEDTLKDTEAGRTLAKEYPQIVIGSRLEGHPQHASQHAAGICITQDAIKKYVAINKQNYVAMCDKKDAEEFNMLKIDMLGLTQLSVFARAMELIGVPPVSGWLEKLPLDDPEAFEVFNKGHFAGVFQFNGKALQSLAKQITIDSLEDIISITALARPGPLACGASNSWVKRKVGREAISLVHPIFEPYLKDTLGIVAYQEQVMQIGREVGDLSWADVTKLRQSMSKSLGTEYFNQWGDKWKEGAMKKGVPEHITNKFWDDLCQYGSWCVSGDTKIKLSNSGSNLPSVMTISELYRRYEKEPSDWIKQMKTKPWLISLADDGKGWPQMATRILKSGRKICWRYKFDDGSSVTCTPEHRFIINGRWQSIGEATPGDSFSSLEHAPSSFVAAGTGRGMGHAKGRKWNIKKGDRTGKHNVAWSGGRVKFEEEFKQRMRGKPCADCGKVFPRMEVHHNDFNDGRDRPKDLAWLCAGDHKRRHYARDRVRRWEKGMIQTSKLLVSKKEVGMRETYDIEMSKHHNFALQNGLITHNSFNRSHSVAYGLISYWCAWFKAHHPVEFAAATLDAEPLPAKQILILRELDQEGVKYKPVDVDRSEERWTIGENEEGSKVLLGPLTLIKGIGPAFMREILVARRMGKPLRDTLAKKLANARTEIDSMFPISDAIERLHPDPAVSVKITTKPTPIIEAQCGIKGDIVIFGVLTRVAPRDDNDPANIVKRGYAVTGPHWSLNMFIRDDTDEIFAKVNRYDYERFGKEILENGRVGKSLWAFKGDVPESFRMIAINNIRYLGELDATPNELIKPVKDEAA